MAATATKEEAKEERRVLGGAWLEQGRRQKTVDMLACHFYTSYSVSNVRLGYWKLALQDVAVVM